jgi:hypothetical protein
LDSATPILLPVASHGETDTPSFIDGLQYHATGGFASARFRASWPFARLDVEADQVTVTLKRHVRFVMRMLGLDIPHRTSLHAGEVRVVEPAFGSPFSRSLRFRTLDPTDKRDGLVFRATRSDRERIVELLGAAGFRIAPRS